jgi:uncharacterized protein (TIGR02147 family)
MDYREVLSNSYQQRRRVNANYSLRAFARDISISPSRLSEIMNGVGQLSREKAVTIAKRLHLSPINSADFLDMVDAVSSPNLGIRNAARERVKLRQTQSKSQKKLDTETFAVMGRPTYVIIWAFMMLPNFDGTAESIGRHLNLNALEISEALIRLECAGLIRRNGSSWVVSSNQFSYGDHESSEIIKEYHRKLSDLGREAIDSQLISERHLDSAILPFDHSRLGEVQQRIAQFTQSLIDEFSQPGDAVYGLSLQYFKIAGPFTNERH